MNNKKYLELSMKVDNRFVPHKGTSSIPSTNLNILLMDNL